MRFVLLCKCFLIDSPLVEPNFKHIIDLQLLVKLYLVLLLYSDKTKVGDWKLGEGQKIDKELIGRVHQVFICEEETTKHTQ